MTRQQINTIVPTVAVCMIETIRKTLPKHSKQHKEIEAFEGQLYAFGKKLNTTTLTEEEVDMGVRAWKAAMSELGVVS